MWELTDTPKMKAGIRISPNPGHPSFLRVGQYSAGLAWVFTGHPGRPVRATHHLRFVVEVDPLLADLDHRVPIRHNLGHIRSGINLPAEGGRVCESRFLQTLPTSADRFIILVHPPRMQDE